MKTVGKKTRLCLGLAVCLLMAASVAVIASVRTPHAYAATETLKQKIVRFTDSDLLDGEPNGGITVQEFAVKYKKAEYRPAGTGSAYVVTDVLSKVIPLELFIPRERMYIWGKNTGLC